MNSRPRYEIVNEKPVQKPRYEIIEGASTPIAKSNSPLDQFLMSLKSYKEPNQNVPGAGYSAMAQGGREIGQGIKQEYLHSFGQPGAEDEYTKQVEAQRKAYNQLPGSQYPESQAFRNIIQSTPEMVALGPLGMEGMFAKMLGTGTALGMEKGLEFVPTGESRSGNILKGAAEGAAMPLIGPALEFGGNAAKFVGRNIKDLPNIFTKPFQDLSPLEQKSAEAKLAADQAKESYNMAVDIHGKSSTNEKSLFNNQQKLQDLYAELADKPHVIPANPEESANNLAKSQLLHEEANTAARNADDSIAFHLNEGAQHDVRVATGVFDKAEAERKKLSNGYKALEADFAKREVPLDNAEDIQNKTDEIYRLIESGHSRSPEMNKVLKELDVLKSEKPKNAKEYLHTIQSVKDYARKAREKAYSYGMNKEERLAHENTFNELDAKAEEMSNILENSVGEEDANRLKELNAGWRERVIPLQRNPIYQRIRHKEQMPADIIGALRGSRDKGNQLIKEHIQNDPELLKHAVGQRYASKPEKLLKVGETAREYIAKMPELKQLIEQRTNAQNAIPLAKQKMEEADLIHREVQSSHAERSSIQNEINDLQESMPALDNKIAELQRKRAEKNISLKEQFKTSNELKKAKQMKEKYWRRFKTLSGLAATGFLGYKAKTLGSALLSRNETPIPGEE